MSDVGWFERIKERWGITSNLSIVLILIAFSLAGSSSIYVSKLILSLFGIDEQTHAFIKTVAWIILIFPAYQVLLLMFGFLLGQFPFFWDKEKKLFRLIMKIFPGK